jgi:hypothetical protein
MNVVTYLKTGEKAVLIVNGKKIAEIICKRIYSVIPGPVNQPR